MNVDEYRVLRALEELGGTGTSVSIARHIATRDRITGSEEVFALKVQAGNILRENIGFTTIIGKRRRHNGTEQKTYRLDIRLPATFREAMSLGRMKV